MWRLQRTHNKKCFKLNPEIYIGFCFSALLYFIRLGKGGNELLVFALAGTFKFLRMSMCV